MRRGKYQHRKIVYEDGYDHYDKNRTIQVIFLVNEAEKNFLDDLTAALQVRNKSDFIRKQVFRVVENLTEEQMQLVKDAAKWRYENDRKGEK